MVSDWFCDKCIMAALPFYKCPDAEILDDVTEFTRNAHYQVHLMMLTLFVIKPHISRLCILMHKP